MSTPDNPLASVIVLGYNDRPYLEGCLGSLLDQSLPSNAYEVIYADNASSDGSADFVAERFPQVKVLRFDRNYGFAEGNNRAAAYAHGRYLCFQNDDTLAHRYWLESLIEAVESDPQARASHAAGRPLHLGGYHERQVMPKTGVLCDLTRFGCVDFTEVPLDGHVAPTLHIAGGSFLVDAQLLKELPYIFDPTFFMYNEDTDLGLRINNLGYKVLFASHAVMYHERAPERRTTLNKKGFRMAYLTTRNRYLTFYKNMYTPEFLLALPLLCLGTVIKLRTFPLSLPRKMVYAAFLLPYSLLALLSAVFQFPKYAGQRRKILQNRPTGRYWLLKELWKRKIPPPTLLSFGVSPA